MNNLTIMYTGLDFQELENKERYQVEVKSKSRTAFLSLLKYSYENICDMYPKDTPKIATIKEEMKYWIKYLNKNYSTKSRVFKVPETIREKDISSLNKDVKKWTDKLLELGDSQIVLEKDHKVQKISKEFSKGMDKNTKEDLKEAFQAMDYELFTPAYMMFFRVAESEIIQLYQKVTKTKPHNLPWGDMLTNIYKEYGVQLPSRVRNIAYYLRDMRNEAHHPGKRFTKNDCEKIKHYLGDLKNEINKI